MENAYIMIPSRMASTRFPGKPLAQIAGKPMIQRVWERCLENRSGARVVVVSEDNCILDTISALGGDVFRSSPGHENGSSRIFEAAQTLKADKVVNVQGDEPFVDISVVDRLLLALSEGVPVCTAHYPVFDEESFHNPNHVKVVCGEGGRCLYFSRSPIPFHRNQPYQGHLVHQGIYAYRFWALCAYVSYGQSFLERSECLEQLRFLEMNLPLHSVEAHMPSIGVDSPEDIRLAEDFHSRTMKTEEKR